jgi:Asp-tRNA(Asn)/Glu-tRNA(Gln) amidotransferase A subunit family amidase
VTKWPPVVELAARIRAGELSATEVVVAALGAIEARNGEINAFVAVDGERALAAAAGIGPGGGKATP